MARIAVTQKGKLLMTEMSREVDDYSFSIKQRDTATIDPQTEDIISLKDTSRNSIPKRLDQVIPRHPTINQTIKHNLESLALEDDSTANINSLNALYANSNFLRNKLARITNGISMPNMPTRKLEPSSIILPTITTGRASVGLSSINGTGINDSFSIPTTTMAYGDYADKFGVNQYPKIRQYESRAARLIEKHIANEKEMLKTAKKVLDTYNKRAQELNADTTKAPDFMEGLREKNPDAVDVLMRETNSLLRKNRRIATYWGQKYKPCQTKFRDITTKRFTAQIEQARERRAEVL